MFPTGHKHHFCLYSFTVNVNAVVQKLTAFESILMRHDGFKSWEISVWLVCLADKLELFPFLIWQVFDNSDFPTG